MISATTALQLIEENTFRMPFKDISIHQCSGYILAKDILSPIDMPPFRQSAMDGYAIKWSKSDKYKVAGEVKAGDYCKPDTKGNAIRIFTGALVPDEYDTVVIQENTTCKNSLLKFEKTPQPFTNIRHQGEQFTRGTKVLQKGHYIREAETGLLASLGIHSVPVYQKPRIAIIVTGNELVSPGRGNTPWGQTIPDGKTYDANSAMLTSALNRSGFCDTSIFRIPDKTGITQSTIAHCLNHFDLLILSGGISVGDYDYVRVALQNNDVNEVFYKVRQKPGKPIYFGKKHTKTVFALPGNPAASLSCFYAYILPALRKLTGWKNINSNRKIAYINETHENYSGKSLFLKSWVENNKLSILGGQSSAMLMAFTQSNALAYIPQECTVLEKGQPIEYIDLNY